MPEALATYAVGEEADVRIIGTDDWLKCQITGLGMEPRTYNIHILSTDLATKFSVADTYSSNIRPEHLRKAALAPAKKKYDEDFVPSAGSSAGVSPGSGQGGEVQRFLSGIGLGRYADKLVNAGFDSMEALRAMEEDDMKQENGMLPGHIRLLQKHLQCGSAPPRLAGGDDEGGDARTKESARQAAREGIHASSLALAAAKFGTSGGCVSINELLLLATAELKQLRPTAATAHEGAAKAAMEPPAAKRRAVAPMGERPPAGPMDDAAKKAAREREEQKQLEIARADMASQMDENYQAAMAAAQASLGAEPDPSGPDDTLASLAQLAEGSAQLVATAASFCANPQADAGVLAAVLDAAQQGAQRASWAAVAAVAYWDSDDFDKESSQKMRRAAVQAAEVAEQYARDCAAAVKMIGKGKVVQRAFCKFYAENRCLKGSSCEFSHDANALPNLPLASKTELECAFFSKGQCTRGAGCPFAHGDEELDEIMRLKTGPAVSS